MSYLNMAVNDLVSVPVFSGLSGALLEYIVNGKQTLFYGNVPILNYFNNYNAAWAYFVVFGGSSEIVNLTGDFVLPLFQNQYLSYLQKLSRPVSVGVVSICMLWIVNSFTLDMYSLSVAFLIGALSEIVGEYSKTLWTTDVNPLLQGLWNNNNNSNPSFNNNSNSSTNNYLPPNSTPPSFSSGGNQYGGSVNGNPRALGSLFGLTGFTPY